MEEIFLATTDLVGWINEEYGPWAGWAAAIVSLFGFAAVIFSMFAWLAR
ncbi:MAG: hypothetical protein ACRCS5_00795 [Sphingomonas sp.]|jgi:hypothetical protein|nr:MULTISPECIES: hypothetical protein [unclassified Sphingomonas]MDR7257970.1 hypothetical protein [Sphingomonas sp. BE270]